MHKDYDQQWSLWSKTLYFLYLAIVLPNWLEMSPIQSQHLFKIIFLG